MGETIHLADIVARLGAPKKALQQQPCNISSELEDAAECAQTTGLHVVGGCPGSKRYHPVILIGTKHSLNGFGRTIDHFVRLAHRIPNGDCFFLEGDRGRYDVDGSIALNKMIVEFDAKHPQAYIALSRLGYSPEKIACALNACKNKKHRMVCVIDDAKPHLQFYDESDAEILLAHFWHARDAHVEFIEDLDAYESQKEAMRTDRALRKLYAERPGRELQERVSSSTYVLMKAWIDRDAHFAFEIQANAQASMTSFMVGLGHLVIDILPSQLRKYGVPYLAVAVENNDSPISFS